MLLRNVSRDRTGLEIDTENVSEDLKIALGFGPGERWFGVVEWDKAVVSDNDNECLHCELTLISKRKLPTRKVIVNHSARQMTLVDRPSAGAIPYVVRAHFVCCQHHVDFLQHCEPRQLCGLPSKPSRGNTTQRW